MELYIMYHVFCRRNADSTIQQLCINLQSYFNTSDLEDNNTPRLINAIMAIYPFIEGYRVTTEYSSTSKNAVTITVKSEDVFHELFIVWCN